MLPWNISQSAIGEVPRSGFLSRSDLPAADRHCLEESAAVFWHDDRDQTCRHRIRTFLGVASRPDNINDAP